MKLDELFRSHRSSVWTKTGDQRLVSHGAIKMATAIRDVRNVLKTRKSDAEE